MEKEELNGIASEVANFIRKLLKEIAESETIGNSDYRWVSFEELLREFTPTSKKL